MHCPSCGHDNREGAKFCKKCGAKLELRCPSCDAAVEAESAFCDECGNALSSSAPAKPASKPPPPADPVSKLGRYLPTGLAEKILAQRGRIEGELRQVTVLFCDMEGYTAMAERLGPEETYLVMNEVYEFLIHKVQEYEGTVNELTGDGIMALFGLPIALEDAPQRALHSALAIQREVVRFNERKKAAGKPVSIKLRVGVHTGTVVAGTVGNDLRVEFKAVGDTVNLASRMQSLAEAGTIYVTEDTYRLAEGYFRFEALGERAIKGKEAPVRIYRVIAPSSRRTRFDVNSERGLTPLVGREREQELLLDGYQRARGGRGQAFSIVAEAGVGKSRLLYEFRKAVANEDATFLEGRCLSYSRGEAYHPVIELLQANFDLRVGESDADAKDKVKRGLQALGLDDAATLPYLLDLLSIGGSGLDPLSMSPEAKKDRTQEAIKRLVLKGSELRPLILAIEDLHWTDKSSEELLRLLLESIAGARVLLLLTYRPEYVHTWGGRSYHSQINLNRLSNRETLALVTHLLGTEEIEENLQELILERTEGVPFFVEELVKSLRDLRIIESKNGRWSLTKDAVAVAIPSTIQDVIMARVDSLPDATKAILQTGSVAGREFGYDLLKAVTNLSEPELLSRLSALKDSELVYERGIFPDTTYLFKHALTQKVVYDSILSQRKKDLHNALGTALEHGERDKTQERCAILAEHFERGENYGKAAAYLAPAYQLAMSKVAIPDAIEYAKRRIACLERLPESEETQRAIIDTRTGLGHLYLNVNRFVELKQTVDPVVKMAEEFNYQRGLASILSLLGAYSYSLEDFQKAIEYLQEGIRLSEATNNISAYAHASNYLGWVFSNMCEFEKARVYFNKALHTREGEKLLWASAASKCNIAFGVHCFQGQIEQFYQMTREPLNMAEESGDVWSKGYVHTFHGICCYWKGIFVEAKLQLVQGGDLCQK